MFDTLSGHPKTRAFITHGGTNGIYEAIYHGVPMVGMPMFADQPDNLVHIKAKGAAVVVNLNFVNTDGLRDAVEKVINDKSYVLLMFFSILSISNYSSVMLNSYIFK